MSSEPCLHKTVGSTFNIQHISNEYLKPQVDKTFFYGHCAATESLVCIEVTLKDVDQLVGESTEMVQAHQAGNQLNNNFPLETTPTMHMTACEDHFVSVALSQHSLSGPSL